MRWTIHHLGGDSYAVHGLNPCQMKLIETLLKDEGHQGEAEASRAERSRQPSCASKNVRARRKVTPVGPIGAGCTISERSHPRLFALFGAGRAHMTLGGEWAEGVEYAEGDAAGLQAHELIAKHPFLGGLVE
jgi:hypothetical protein